MFFGIVLSKIFSKSFKKKILIRVDTFKKPYHLNGNNFVEKDFFYPKIEFKYYPELSVPVKMTLGKLQRVESPYRPRFNLSFIEHVRIFEITRYNLGFMSNSRLNIDY